MACTGLFVFRPLNCAQKKPEILKKLCSILPALRLFSDS
uniref:Uncharacterized protein n=1 Tax=Faecalibaculum rodentium TaxID=1702221 RepID=A0A140DRN0_9FIRM|nr:hypothetical protein AALO17_01730 [Faecalibaculum rodentium]